MLSCVLKKRKKRISSVCDCLYDGYKTFGISSMSLSSFTETESELSDPYYSLISEGWDTFLGTSVLKVPVCPTLLSVIFFTNSKISSSV